MDYYSTELETIKKELKEKVKAAFAEKQKLYETTLGESFATAEKKITDGFSLTSPSELYNTYEAYTQCPYYQASVQAMSCKPASPLPSITNLLLTEILMWCSTLLS